MLVALCLAPAGDEYAPDSGPFGDGGSTGTTGQTGRWQLQVLDDAGVPTAERRIVGPADLQELEQSAPRWVWDCTASIYPGLLAAGVSVERCHDITLTERILATREGRYGEPSAAAAVHARVLGLDVPADPEPGETSSQPVLFDAAPPAGADSDPLEILQVAAADQVGRSADDNALRLLIAAESASALAAVEMGRRGLPLRAAVHGQLLVDALGPRPAPGGRPAKMAAIAARINEAFGHPVNADSAMELRNAFRRAGFDVETTRSWVIRELDHPAVEPVLEYKELSRLFTANGWNWAADWVREDRFRTEYLPGGVVSGRWATRGGGGLQIPRLVRRAVIAEPGYLFVVADAAQLEPRVLAAVSGDPALQAVSAQEDLYSALAEDGFGGDRAHAKVAMLGAMYGATSGESGRLLPTLRQRYPVAMACVESAARQGEKGETVRSILGRTSPRPGPEWWDTVQAGSMPDATPAQEQRARQVARGWGRFTRNFIIQASAADWASVWLSVLRKELRAVEKAELVFFQHDELVVHAPAATAERVRELTVQAAESARRLVFPRSSAATPVHPVLVECYADVK